MPTTPTFRPVERVFHRLVGRGPGGGALAVRLRGETVVDLSAGTPTAAGTRPWTPDTAGDQLLDDEGHRLDRRAPPRRARPARLRRPRRRPLARVRRGRQGAGDGPRRARPTVPGCGACRRSPTGPRTCSTTSRWRSAWRRHGPRAPDGALGYHAITYGWLSPGCCAQITGARDGRPRPDRDRRAARHRRDAHRRARRGARARRRARRGRAAAGRARSRLPGARWTRARRAQDAVEALHVARLPPALRGPGAADLDDGDAGRQRHVQRPRARAALRRAGHARRRAPPPETVDELGRVQVRTPDAVLGMRMRWRLGYHQAFGAGRGAPRPSATTATAGRAAGPTPTRAVGSAS